MSEHATTEQVQTETSSARLTLPRSGIVLEDGAVVRRSRTGDVIASHPLRDITSLELVRRWSPGAIVTSAIFAGAAISARLWVASGFWSWIGCLGFGALAGLLLLGSWTQVLCIETNGVTARYELVDADHDCEGFAASLRGEWMRVRG